MQFQIYHAALRSRIKKNWFLPEGLLKKTDISADILVRIAQNGRIEETRFERKSGHETFDQEVVRTLKKSEPLPPLPEGYPRSSYEVVLTFHSRDLGGQ
jgi:TonB family protein